jgi:hypothetical protein
MMCPAWGARPGLPSQATVVVLRCEALPAALPGCSEVFPDVPGLGCPVCSLAGLPAIDRRHSLLPHWVSPRHFLPEPSWAARCASLPACQPQAIITEAAVKRMLRPRVLESEGVPVLPVAVCLYRR